MRINARAAFSFYGFPHPSIVFSSFVCGAHTNDYCTKPCRLLQNIIFICCREILVVLSERVFLRGSLFPDQWRGQFIFHVRFNASQQCIGRVAFKWPIRPPPWQQSPTRSLVALFQCGCCSPGFLYSVNRRVLLDRLHQILPFRDRDFISMRGWQTACLGGHRCAPSHTKGR
jgi:hypothetical protein